MTPFAYSLDSWAGIISILVGLVLPLVVAVFTKDETNKDVKFIGLAVLAGVTSVLTQLVQALNTNASFNAKAVLLSAVITLLTALGAHYGGWKGTKTQGKLLHFGDSKHKRPRQIHDDRLVA